VSQEEKYQSPMFHSMCEIEQCLNPATKIIKNLNSYLWVCSDCYGKHRV
jgi:hypothetical protein